MERSKLFQYENYIMKVQEIHLRYVRTPEQCMKSTQKQHLGII